MLLQLEELETRSLLSASAVAALTHNDAFTPSASTSFSGYTPQQLQTAYGVPSTINGQLAGTGETIAIVDAYNDPNIAKDLATFDAKYGLPSANLTVVNQNGSSTNLPANNSSWAVEEALDVEWAHAIAPGAKIILVEANSNNLSALMTAVNTAGHALGANVVSMSWGASEFAGETTYDKYFTAAGVTYVASAGDSSAFFGPEWPASSPSVLAVGGTTLKLTSSNTISNETAWSASFSPSYGIEGGGGGISSIESAPSYQSSNGVNYTGRTSPDVAWDANPTTGVSIYDSYGEPGWGYVGGTSAGAPAWSGIVAIADQQYAANGGKSSLSTAVVENTLYQAYSGKSGNGYSTYFHDITSGSNGFPATKGYDLATGLGSPNVSALVSLLAGPTSHSSTSTNGTTGGTATTTVPSPSHGTGHGTRSYDIFVTDGATSVSVIVVIGPAAPISVPIANPTGSSASVANNVVNNVSIFGLTFAQPALSTASNVPLVKGSLAVPAAHSNLFFGASGWKGSSFSWRLSSLGLPAPLIDQLADELPEDLQDVNERSAKDADHADADTLSENWSALHMLAPPLFDSDDVSNGAESGSSEGGDAGGDGGGE